MRRARRRNSRERRAKSSGSPVSYPSLTTMTAGPRMHEPRRVSAIEILQTFADARAAGPSGGQEVQALLRSPRVRIAQRFPDVDDPRVEDEAMDVRELARTARARGADKKNCTGSSTGSRRAAGRGADAPGAGLSTRVETACRRWRRSCVWCVAGRDGGPDRSAPRGAVAGASNGARIDASVPRYRAPGRRDRGRGNRWTRATLRGSRHAVRGGRHRSRLRVTLGCNRQPN